MSFDRLLTVATLTPAQASLVAVQLLDAAEASSRGDAEHATGARLGAVTLTPAGDIEVATPRLHQGTPVTGLLQQLLQNARRLPVHPSPEQVRLLHRLEEAVGDRLRPPGERARELEATLTDTLGPGARQRLTEQLATLVDAFAHVAPGIPAMATLSSARPVGPAAAPVPVPADTSPAPASSSTAPRRGAPARVVTSRSPRRSRSRLHRRTGGRRLAVLAAVVVAVLAVAGYVVVRDGGVGGTLGAFGAGSGPTAQATGSAAQSTKQSTKQTHAHQRAVPAFAGLHAGPITGVSVLKTAKCAPGRLCRVKVTVHLQRAATTRTVAWKVGAAHVCTKRIAWSPTTTMTARPGWTTVYAHTSIRAPKNGPLALVALTTAPARAQSRPVPVSGSSLRC